MIKEVIPVHDPRSRVVRSEADGNVVTRHTNVDDVALDGIYVVVGIAPSAADDIERVAMKVERVLYEYRLGQYCGFGNMKGQTTHATTCSTTWDGNFDGLSGIENVDRTGGEEVLCGLAPGEYLKKDGDRRRNEGRAIDSELEKSGVLQNKPERNQFIRYGTRVRESRRHTKTTSRLMLMSAPPGVGSPGTPVASRLCNVQIRYQRAWTSGSEDLR